MGSPCGPASALMFVDQSKLFITKCTPNAYHLTVYISVLLGRSFNILLCSVLYLHCSPFPITVFPLGYLGILWGKCACLCFQN